MAIKSLKVEFCLGDYFDKYGFGDGDDGAATSCGHEYISVAANVLNLKFHQHGLQLEAEGWQVGGIHNDCRLFIHRIGVEDELYTSEDELDRIGDIAARNKFLNAMREASSLFDDVVEGRAADPGRFELNGGSEDPLEG